MRIAEIFHSIQGEGELTGVPSVFIRTSGCNLRCRWCDTPYASWFPEGDEMEIAEIVTAAASFPARHCVLTGGEPMVARDLPGLAAALRGAGFHITIETAGTMPPDGIACDLASVSPKLANSVPVAAEAGRAWVERHESARHAPSVLREWLEGYNTQIKFVISSPDDLAEAEALVRETGIAVPPSKILLMPEALTAAELDTCALDLVAVCKEKGYRFCDRLHIRLFGHTRGT